MILSKDSQVADLSSKYRWHLPIFLFFVVASLGLFIPWIMKPNGVLFALPGDPYGTVWYIWFSKYAMQHGISTNFTELIGAPYGFTQGPVVYYFWTNLYLPFNLFFGEIFTYNLLIYLSFPLAGFTMYLLTWHVTRNRYASLIAGFIFTFSPYHLMRSLQHLTLAHIQLIPLFFLALIRLKERRIPLNWAFVMISFVLLLLSDYHYGFFGAIIAFVIIVFIFVDDRRHFKKEKAEKVVNRKWLFSMLACVIGAVLIALIIMPIIANWTTVKSTAHREIDQLYVYSARPIEYLIPSIDNPFFGRLAEKASSQGLHGSNSTEQTLYLGLVSIIFATVAIFSLRSEESSKRRFVVYLAIIGAITSFLFSLAPTFNIFGLNIPMPSYFIYKLVPVFRVYARFGIFVMLFASLLAGIGLTWLIEKIKSRQMKAIFVLGALIIITIEFINIPPWRFIAASGKAIPKVYRWMAKQPGNFIVAEYPLVASAEYPSTQYLYYQRIHKKRLLNGAFPGSKADRVRQQLIDLQDPKLGQKLRKIRIKYLIVHQDIYLEGMIAKKDKRYFGGPKSPISNMKYNNGQIPQITSHNIKLIKQLGNDLVYEITEKS